MIMVYGHFKDGEFALKSIFCTFDLERSINTNIKIAEKTNGCEVNEKRAFTLPDERLS